MIEIVDGSLPEHLPVVRELFLEYSEWLDFDFCSQGFDEELAALPGLYAPPSGRILLALDGGMAAGVVALRPLPVRHDTPCSAPLVGQTQHGLTIPSEGVCEMKRMWVRPEYRGTGLGRRLALEIVEAGRQSGYETMVLDTLEKLVAARTLYASIGFEEIGPYYENPIDGVRYMKLGLK